MFFIKKERVGKGYHLYKGASVCASLIYINFHQHSCFSGRT